MRKAEEEAERAREEEERKEREAEEASRRWEVHDFQGYGMSYQSYQSLGRVWNVVPTKPGTPQVFYPQNDPYQGMVWIFNKHTKLSHG